jgi:carbon storage regulator
MLVLTRKVGEELVVDGDIRVTVLSVKRGQVRIGINAPPKVKVIRAELATAPQAHAAGTCS